jgi:hypothetical protein
MQFMGRWVYDWILLGQKFSSLVIVNMLLIIIIIIIKEVKLSP